MATALTERLAATAFAFWCIAITTSVALLDDGPRALVGPLQRSELEYSGAVERVHGVGQFLCDYPRLASTMPMHAQVHPPGAVLFLWTAERVLVAGPWGQAAGIILFSALSVILLYCWASRIGGPGVARRAAAIFVLTPSTVLFTATSMDGPFAVFLIATMWLFWEALQTPLPCPIRDEAPHTLPSPPAAAGAGSDKGGKEPGAGARGARPPFWSRPLLFGALGGLAAGLAALMTYSVAVAVLFCGLAACVWWWPEPGKRAVTVLASAAAIAGFVSLNLALWLTTGYDPVQMFRVAVANSNHIMAGTRHESPARYGHLVVANLVVFFIAAGLPSTAIWFPTIRRSLHQWIHGHPPDRHIAAARTLRSDNDAHRFPAAAADKFAVTALLTLLIADLAPIYMLEVERIWMFLIPLVVIPVAGRLFEQERGTGRVPATLAVATLLALQTLVTEVLLTTYW